MLRELEERLKDDNSRFNLREALRVGPWCWPREEDPALAHAQWATGCSQPPAPASRSVLAVTLNGRSGNLWMLGGPGSSPTHTVFGPEASGAWENAICALPRSLPMLWASIRPHREKPAPWYLGSHAPGLIAVPEATIDGPSVGLAFFLLLASRVLEADCPADVVASATLNASGSVGPVDGLETKIETIVDIAPRVRRLLVSADQASHASEIARGRLEVLGVKNAADAAQHLFPDLAGRLVKVEGREKRHRMAMQFFRLVLSGRSEYLEWEAVWRAAGTALESWKDLPADDRRTLEFAAAVALRHHTNQGELPLPEPLWLASLTTPLRIEVVAHLVQHSADTGTPPAQGVLALAARDLPIDSMRAFERQLRLQGAVARLEAVRGDAAAALGKQRGAAKAHLANLDYADVSYPLCEWFRLAGALCDRSALDEATELFEEAEALGAFCGDRSYVRLARARAEVQAGAATQDVLDDLCRLAADPRVSDHVRLSAARWAIHCARALGAPHTCAAAEEYLDGACSGGGSPNQVYGHLRDLDAAIADGDGPRACQLVEEIRRCQPGVMSHLTKDRDPAELPQYVARFFPY